MPYATVVGRTIMAAAGKKKYVQQDELRRLMKATQRETASKKKVESPLAKYNSLGQLFCALCNIPIKSELLWQAHILGKLHKEKVKELKGFKEQMSSDCVSSAQTTKRKGPILETLTNKRTKDSVEQSSGSSTDSKQLLGFFRTSDQPPHKQTLGNASNMHLPVGEYEAHVEEEEDCESSPVFPSATPQSVEIPLPPRTVPESSLPPDFFDSKSLLFSHSGSILKAEIIEKPVERKENTAEALPEGFFDDPEVDAKVLNFLQAGFDKGLKTSSLKVQISALSAFFDTSLAEHMWIQRLGRLTPLRTIWIKNGKSFRKKYVKSVTRHTSGPQVCPAYVTDTISIGSTAPTRRQNQKGFPLPFINRCHTRCWPREKTPK
ncbi:zinc finger protein 830 isoform X2 [Engystomops pustulosus]|uniref:zinc finger protein 830 isoform X2 n=1 Tax=Engystomops pustulosus TaxID=76066 RepID=UPI003AFB544C